VVEAPVAVAAEVEETIASAADTVIDNVTATQQEALESIEAARQVVIDGVSRAQRGMADFVSERLRKDLEIQQAFLRCKTFDEVRNVQAEFFRIAVDQYSTEATRLLRISGEIVSKSLVRSA